jgi:ferredoxin
LNKSWHEAGRRLEASQNKREQLMIERQANSMAPTNSITPTHNTTTLAGSVSFGRLVEQRAILMGALRRYPQRMAFVELPSSDTELPRCTGCGNCVAACPLGARRLVNGNSAILFSNLSVVEQPQSAQVAFTNRVACLGCSACVQHCPHASCMLDSLSGSELLGYGVAPLSPAKSDGELPGPPPPPPKKCSSRCFSGVYRFHGHPPKEDGGD